MHLFGALLCLLFAPCSGSGARQLQVAPTELNELLGSMRLDLCEMAGDLCERQLLPNMEYTHYEAWNLPGKEYTCDGIRVGGLSLTASQPSPGDVLLQFDIQRLELSCGLGYAVAYRRSWRPDLKAEGSATATSTAAQENSLSLAVHIRSSGADYSSSLPRLPPEVQACTPTHSRGAGFDVSLDVEGDNFWGGVAAAFDGTIKRKIVSALNDFICDEQKGLPSKIPALLGSLLGGLNEGLEPLVPLLSGPPSDLDDAMCSEQQLQVRAEAVPPLLDLRSWWIQPFVSHGRETLSLSYMAENVVELVQAYALPDSTLLSDGELEIQSLPGGLLGAQHDIELGGADSNVLEVHVGSIRVGGLNSFKAVDLLQLIGDYTISNALALERITLEIDLDLTIRPNADAQGVDFADLTPITEHVVLQTSIDQPSVELAVMVAIEESLFDVSLGDALHNPLGCLLPKVLEDSNVTDTRVTIGGVEHLTVDGFISPAIDQLFDRVSHAAFVMYDEVGSGLLPLVAETKIRSALNDAKESLLSEYARNAACQRHEEVPPDSAVDFGNLVFNGVNFTELLLKQTERLSVSALNDKIAKLTNETGQPGSYVHPDRLVDPVSTSLTDVAWRKSQWIRMNPERDVDAGPDASWPLYCRCADDSANLCTHRDFVGAPPGNALDLDVANSRPENHYNRPARANGCNNSYEDLFEDPGVCNECSRIGDVHFEMGNLRVSGLNSLTKVSVLNPSGVSSVRNNVAVAGPVQISVDIALQVQGNTSKPNPLHIDDTFSLSLNLTGVDVVLDMLLNIDEGRFMNLSLGDLVPRDLSEDSLEQVVRRLARTLQQVRVNDLELDFGSVSLGVDCASCTSPMLVYMSEERGPTDITEEVNNLTRSLAADFTATGFQRQLDIYLAQPTVSLFSPDLHAEVGLELQAAETNSTACADFDGPICALKKKQGQCNNNTGSYMAEHCRLSCGLCSLPAHEQRVEETDALLWALVATTAVIVLCASTILCAASFRRRKPAPQRQRNSTLEGLLPAALAVVPPGRDVEQCADATGAAGGGRVPSLFMDPHLALWQRMFVPVVICLNVAIFVVGHVHTGATVDVVANATGNYVRLDRFVEFSLGHSLLDMWNGNAFTLFWMVFIFSGVWPYFKLILLLGCWFVPPRKVWVLNIFGMLFGVAGAVAIWYYLIAPSPHACRPLPDWLPMNYPCRASDIATHWMVFWAHIVFVLLCAVAMRSSRGPRARGKLLTLLDISGTCSLLDLYVLCMCILAFRLHIKSPDIPGVPAELYLLDVVVTPVLGLYAFIVGVFVSITINYTALHWHRKTLRSAAPDTEYNAGRLMPESRARMSLFGFLAENGSTGTALPCVGGLFLMVVGSVAVFAAGATMVSFDFKIYGIAQLLIDAGIPESSLREFSMLDSIYWMAQGQIDLDGYGGHLGVYAIAAVFSGCCFVIPLLVLLITAVQLLLPMTLRQQKRAFALNEFFRAWSASEVYVAAVYVAALQMAQVSGFILKSADGGCTSVVETLIRYFPMFGAVIDPAPGTNQCFIIEAQPRRGLFVLMCAVALAFVTVHSVQVLSQRAIKKRYEHLAANPEEENQLAANDGIEVPELTADTVRDYPPARLSYITAKAQPETVVQKEPEPSAPHQPLRAVAAMWALRHVIAATKTDTQPICTAGAPESCAADDESSVNNVEQQMKAERLRMQERATQEELRMQQERLQMEAKAFEVERLQQQVEAARAKAAASSAQYVDT